MPLWPNKHSKYLRSTPGRWTSYGRSFDTAKFAVAEKFQAQTASARSAAECQVMNRFFCRSALLLLPALLPLSAWACPQQTVSVADSAPKSPAGATHPSALAVGHVFAFPVATKSVDAQRLVETALDQYENVLLDNSIESARKATEKDPQFALAYAVWSFAARRNQPNPEAARKAESLAGTAPADELPDVRAKRRHAARNYCHE